ncbi:MAG: PIN domain-containing protein [Thermodesulfovibrionales bacterium]|nr:PIN domain-containing protein [Thermodesulfovibrionales bacterium]
MIAAVDTNILLDILIPDAEFALTSKELLDEANNKGAIIISEMVYGELASQFDSREELDKFISHTGIKVVHTNLEALWLAGEAWKVYRSKRKGEVECVKCGSIQRIICNKCGFEISYRQHIISDFIIGAHAFLQSDLLLSRDRGFYKTYFKELALKP